MLQSVRSVWMMDIQVDNNRGKRRSFPSIGGSSTLLKGRWDLSKRWTTLKLMLMLHCFFAADSKVSVSDEMQFLVEPHDILAVQNEAAILNCAVESSPPADIYWIKDGVTIQYDNRRYKLQNNSLLFTFIEHSSSHRPDEGLYQCAASIRSQGTIVSRKAKLQVAYINGFVQEPRSQSVHLGDTVVIFCELDALPHPTVYWYKDNRALNASSTNHFIHSNNALELRNLRSSDFGRYQCRAVNQGGERFSLSAQITENVKASGQVSPPEFLAVPPTEVDVVEGESVALFCAASGRDGNGGISRIEWLKDGLPLVVTEMHENRLSRWSIEGQGSLRIDSVSEGDGGQYTCRALASNASIETLSTVRILVPPRFLTQPSGVTALVNSDVELECEVYASPPARVEWLKNGDVVIASDYFQVIDGRNLRILGLVESDEGMYQCTATNNAGMIQASARLVISQTRASLVNNGVPFAPVGLSLVIIAASSVTVTWQSAPLSKAQNSAHGYIVSWKEEGSRRERTLNTTFLEATIQRLKSSTKYAIQVKAYNVHGPSRDTAELHVETLHTTELRLQAMALSSTSIHLSWEGLLSQQEPITHYKLYYSSTEDSEEEPGETDVNVVENHYTIKDLLKFHKYRLRVVAFSRNGPGRSSEEVLCHTFSDVPSAAPQNITADAVSSTSIVIGWDPPPEGTQNGVIKGYKIEYKQRKDKVNLNILAEGGKRSFDFTDLEKGTEYVFRVQALTVNGSGPTSAWLMKETLKHDLDETRVPGKASSLRVRPLSDAIMVSWTPPMEQDIRIRGYVLGYGIGIPDIFRQILDPRRRHHTVKGLKPSSEYVISLKAFNYAGEAIPVYETTVTREMTTPEPQMPLMPPVGIKPVVLSSTTVMLTWSDTTLGRSQRINDNRFYTIRYNPKFQFKYRFVNTTDLSALIEDLRPDTEYEFSVKVSKGTRQSTWSLSAFNSTREAAPSTSPRDMTLVPVGGSSAITVNWQPPRLANGQITGYLLYYSTDSTLPDSDWVVEGVLGDRLSATVRDLSADTTYYFKIQARNAVGPGPMAPTVVFRTLKADGRRDGVLETSDGLGRHLPNTETPGTDLESDGMDSMHLWIIIGCIGGSVIIILLVTMVAVVCCFCSRCRPTNRKQMSGSPKSKRMHKGLKPPDLWIHGNVELSEMEHIDPDDISEVESATIGHRRKRSSNDKGGRDDDRYRSASLRHVPLVIPVDTPPTYREPVGDPLSLAYHSRSSTGNTTFPSRSQYAATPRVNIADITVSNPDREMSSGSSSFKVLPSNPMTSPQVRLPLLTPEERLVDNLDNSSDLPNCISTEELTEEMANIEGLMKDLNNITRLHFSY